jgi:flagellar biosynthesis/type III secretory pathway chaperone
MIDIFILYRSRATAKTRRNYVDDALESLDNKNQSLTELLEEMKQLNQSNEERLKQIEEDNMHLRSLLDEVCLERKRFERERLLTFFFFFF